MARRAEQRAGQPGALGLLRRAVDALLNGRERKAAERTRAQLEAAEVRLAEAMAERNRLVAAASRAADEHYASETALAQLRTAHEEALVERDRAHAVLMMLRQRHESMQAECRVRDESATLAQAKLAASEERLRLTLAQANKDEGELREQLARVVRDKQAMFHEAEAARREAADARHAAEARLTRMSENEMQRAEAHASELLQLVAEKQQAEDEAAAQAEVLRTAMEQLRAEAVQRAAQLESQRHAALSQLSGLEATLSQAKAREHEALSQLADLEQRLNSAEAALLATQKLPPYGSGGRAQLKPLQLSPPSHEASSPPLAWHSDSLSFLRLPVVTPRLVPLEYWPNMDMASVLVGIAAGLFLTIFITVRLLCACIHRGGRQRIATREAATSTSKRHAEGWRRVIEVQLSASRLGLAAALREWRANASAIRSRMEARDRALQAVVRGEELQAMSRMLTEWCVAAVAIESALHQQSLHEIAILQMIQRAESRMGSSRPASSIGQRDQCEICSSKRSDSTAELRGSLRSLGANILRVAKTQTRDARTVVAAPRKLFSATRSLMPKLVDHVSPTRLINALVKEVNDCMQMTESEGLEEYHGGGALPSHLQRGFISPTEAALREHNEELAAHDAANAAATIFDRLPPMIQGEWDQPPDEWLGSDEL